MANPGFPTDPSGPDLPQPDVPPDGPLPGELPPPADPVPEDVPPGQPMPSNDPDIGDPTTPAPGPDIVPDPPGGPGVTM